MESEDVSTKQQRIAELAWMHPEVSFTSLAYHVDLKGLHEAYLKVRKDGAVGIDEQPAFGLDDPIAALGPLGFEGLLGLEGGLQAGGSDGLQKRLGQQLAKIPR